MYSWLFKGGPNQLHYSQAGIHALAASYVLVEHCKRLKSEHITIVIYARFAPGTCIRLLYNIILMSSLHILRDISDEV